MSEKTTVDGEQVSVIRTEPMSPAPTTDLALHGQTEQGIALFEERARNSKRMFRAALQITAPGQWMVYGEGDKRSVYATAGAAERILRQGFGMRWGEKTVALHSDDVAMVATAEADLLNSDGSVYERFMGTRRATFDKDAPGGVKGYLKDEQSVIKGALANMKHRAVTSLLGITFMTPDDFREAGLDLDKLQRRVTFQDHGEGPVSSAPRIEFGKNKGKLLTDLNDKSLDWYINAAQENLADSSKAKYHAKEQYRLQGYMAEKARRSNTAETPPPSDSGEMPNWDDSEHAE